MQTVIRPALNGISHNSGGKWMNWQNTKCQIMKPNLKIEFHSQLDLVFDRLLTIDWKAIVLQKYHIYNQLLYLTYHAWGHFFVISIITWQKVFYFQKIPFRRTPIISAVHNDIFPCAFGQKVSKDILFNFIAFVVWPFFLFRLIPSTRQYMHYRPDIHSI